MYLLYSSLLCSLVLSLHERIVIISNSKGKRKILGNCWLNEEEEADIRKLAEKVEVEVRAVPNEQKKILVHLL